MVVFYFELFYVYGWFFFLFLFFLFLSHLYVCVPRICLVPAENLRFSGTAIDGFETLCECWELNPDPLQEQGAELCAVSRPSSLSFADLSDQESSLPRASERSPVWLVSLGSVFCRCLPPGFPCVSLCVT